MGACFSGPPRPPEPPRWPAARPAWTAPPGLTPAKLAAMRAEFWETAPHYGGDAVIWHALKAAAECEDVAGAAVVLDAAGVLTGRAAPGERGGVSPPGAPVTLYDERGRAYDLPEYALADPVGWAA